MKTLKTLSSILFVLLLVCCNKKESINDIERANTEHILSEQRSFTDTTRTDYKGQLPYLNGSSTNNSNDLAITYDFETKLNDANVSWEVFDSIYDNHANLTIPEKQHLAYIILSSKDLIGLYQNSNNDPQLEQKLIKYTSMLVNSNYIGYCLLYTSLNILNQNNSPLVKTLIDKIDIYSKTNSFHEDTISNTELTESEMASYYHKIKDDYKYLNKIFLIQSIN